MKANHGLGLKHPEPKQQSSVQFGDFGNEAIHAWMNELPRNQLGVCAKAYYDFLVELNLTQMPPEHRHEVILLILGPIYGLLEQINSHYLQSSALSSDKKRTIILLMQAISLEIANGFKIIITDLLPQIKQNKSNLQDCIFQLSMLYMDIIRKSYERYTPPPPNLWFEWHQLYHYAMMQKFHNKPCNNPGTFMLRHQTIEQSYKHGLLLACTTPFRWSPKEIKSLVYTLEQWAELVELSPEVSQGVFLVDLGKDLPPRGAHIDYPKSKHCYALDFSGVIERLELIKAFHVTRIPNKKTTQLEEQFPHSMAEFLVNSWSKVSKRGSDRVEKTGSLRIQLGLCNTFDLIHEPEDTSDIAVDHNTIIMDAHPLPNQTDKASSAELFLDAESVNISPTGMCIDLPDPIPGDLKAGQVIAIEMPDSPDHICVGMIRWVKHTSKHTTRCGIELLSAKPHAVYCFLNKPQSENEQGIKCLWLPNDPSLNPCHSLLVPRLPFKTEKGVYIKTDHNHVMVRLAAKRASTACFYQFNINPQDIMDIPFLKHLHTKQIQELWQHTEL